jgi:hypothetical protein
MTSNMASLLLTLPSPEVKVIFKCLFTNRPLTLLHVLPSSTEVALYIQPSSPLLEAEKNFLSVTTGLIAIVVLMIAEVCHHSTATSTTSATTSSRCDCQCIVQLTGTGPP